jgi:hypothetical protein
MASTFASDIRWLWTAANLIKGKGGTEICVLRMYNTGSQRYTPLRLLVLFLPLAFPVPTRRQVKRVSLCSLRTWSWMKQVLPTGCKQSTTPYSVIPKFINLFSYAFQISVRMQQFILVFPWNVGNSFTIWITVCFNIWGVEYLNTLLDPFQYIIWGARIGLLPQHSTQIKILW